MHLVKNVLLSTYRAVYVPTHGSRIRFSLLMHYLGMHLDPFLRYFQVI